ncbi:sensor histidine kinase [Enterococcus sp. LJL120]
MGIKRNINFWLRLLISALAISLGIVFLIVFILWITDFQHVLLDYYGQTQFQTQSNTQYFSNDASSFSYDYSFQPRTTISGTQLNTLILRELFNRLGLLFLLLFLISFSLLVLFWRLFEGYHRKKTLRMIENLKQVETLADYQGDDSQEVQRVLHELQESYSQRYENFRRLNSYLAHDQKNTIAIIKTRLAQSTEFQEEAVLLDYLTHSVDDILTLSSSETETTEFVDVALLAAEVCDAYKKVYPQLSFEFSEIAETTILAKNRWIYRALANLIDNAIKYGENQKIEVSVSRQYQNVVVAVKDQGIGLTETEQENIFKESYRVRGLKSDGYGIGLAVVSHVCDLCQGYVFVDSQAKKGSTFYMSFPLA